MPKKLTCVILTLVLFGVAPYPACGSELVWRSIGLRGGANDGSNEEDFKQYEGFAIWSLPWSRQWNFGWSLGTYLEANAGILSGGGKSAFVGALGPGIYLTGLEGIVEILLGINPTIISKHKFGDENLGGPVQFTSHVGLNIIFVDLFHIGYRLQHMSNAIIYEHNPGLNTHMIELGYRF
jgi:hypothetical protein